MQRCATHAQREEPEQTRNCHGDDPVHVERVTVGILLGGEDGQSHHNVDAERGGIADELDEKLEARDRDYAAHPWTEVIQLLNAPVDL